MNAQTLQGAMSNLAEENDGELPEGVPHAYSRIRILRCEPQKGARKVKPIPLTVSTDDHCYCGVSFQADYDGRPSPSWWTA